MGFLFRRSLIVSILNPYLGFHGVIAETEPYHEKPARVKLFHYRRSVAHRRRRLGLHVKRFNILQDIRLLSPKPDSVLIDAVHPHNQEEDIEA